MFGKLVVDLCKVVLREPQAQDHSEFLEGRHCKSFTRHRYLEMSDGVKRCIGSASKVVKAEALLVQGASGCSRLGQARAGRWE